MECSYGARPHLLLSDHTLFSCSGVQQGDPLGPLGFALALHLVVSRINHEAPGLLLNSWYLDYGTLCGSLDDLATALAIIESEGPPQGLILKSLIVAPHNHQVTQSSLLDIPVCHEGFTLPGSPLGPANYRRDVRCCFGECHKNPQLPHPTKGSARLTNGSQSPSVLPVPSQINSSASHLSSSHHQECTGEIQ